MRGCDGCSIHNSTSCSRPSSLCSFGTLCKTHVEGFITQGDQPSTTWATIPRMKFSFTANYGWKELPASRHE
ncbi:hypothetical protein Agabi119p4_7025 [Agaricus bisporus var. burnettii]|uniref:Uncharacterized protein n=1 Tax=Agaricus bisporus var. burnettii TaxID=192524 RepID=A0A8H7F0K4_AGABI|nr:hypothetical protein Agabi119p4_7025 [Agaricus bisporus var. burnettii]